MRRYTGNSTWHTQTGASRPHLTRRCELYPRHSHPVPSASPRHLPPFLSPLSPPAPPPQPLRPGQGGGKTHLTAGSAGPKARCRGGSLSTGVSQPSRGVRASGGSPGRSGPGPPSPQAASAPESPRAALPTGLGRAEPPKARAEVELRGSEKPEKGRKPASLGNVAAGANKRLRPAPSERAVAAGEPPGVAAV